MNNPGQQPPNICFYSNKCRLSEAFIKALATTSFKREFQFICVDGKVAELKRRHPWLERTPTIIIRGEDEPRTGNEVMNWVSEKQIMSQGNGPSAGNPGSQEPEPWVGNEMGGALTKSYSVLMGADSQDAPMGNFEFLNGQQATGTRTASDIPGGGLGARGQQQKSKKEALFDKQMEDYMKARTQGMPQAPLRQ